MEGGEISLNLQDPAKQVLLPFSETATNLYMAAENFNFPTSLVEAVLENLDCFQIPSHGQSPLFQNLFLDASQRLAQGTLPKPTPSFLLDQMAGVNAAIRRDLSQIVEASYVLDDLQEMAALDRVEGALFHYLKRMKHQDSARQMGSSCEAKRTRLSHFDRCINSFVGM